MIVGSYTLDLYCDNCTDFNMKNGVWTPQQFTGTDRGTCMREARGVGWIIGKHDKFALCPACTARGIVETKEASAREVRRRKAVRKARKPLASAQLRMMFPQTSVNEEHAPIPARD